MTKEQRKAYNKNYYEQHKDELKLKALLRQLKAEREQKKDEN